MLYVLLFGFSYPTLLFTYTIYTQKNALENHLCLWMIINYYMLSSQLQFFSLLITIILIYEALSHIWVTKMEQNIKDKKNKIMDLWWSLCTYVYLFLSYSHIFIFLLQTFLCNIIHVNTLAILVHKKILQIFVVCFLLFMNFIKKNMFISRVGYALV